MSWSPRHFREETVEPSEYPASEMDRVEKGNIYPPLSASSHCLIHVVVHHLVTLSNSCYPSFLSPIYSPLSSVQPSYVLSTDDLYTSPAPVSPLSPHPRPFPFRLIYSLSLLLSTIPTSIFQSPSLNRQHPTGQNGRTSSPNRSSHRCRPPLSFVWF